MAITISKQPVKWMNSGNPLVYVFSTNQSAQANFSFIIETLLDNVVLSVDKVFIERVTNTAHWDASSIVNDFMNSPVISPVIVQPSVIGAELKINIRENYGSPAVNQSITPSNTVTIFNCTLPDDEWIDASFAADFVDAKFLTDVPNKTFYITKNQDVPLNLLSEFGSGVLLFDFYDENGYMFFSSGLYVSSGILNFNFKFQLLQSYFGGVVNSASYFTVSVNPFEVYTFKFIEDECLQPYSLVWINKYGSFDMHPITHNLEQEKTIESSSYKKQFGNWSGNSFVFDGRNTGEVDFQKKITEKGTLHTGYMSSEVQNWFISVYESPRVFLYGSDGYMFPIRITETKSTLEQDRFEDLIMESIKFEKSINYQSIRL